ncbi:MAG: hypothetical protein DRI77_11060 [Chloroflexi bacterium]|nr:MAG: hypothetical protein DRI77_11060 [Chloroflexota bacterium]
MSSVSANPGQENEVAVALVTEPGWHYIVVLGHDGAHDPAQTYGLLAEAHSFGGAYPACTATLPYSPTTEPMSFYQAPASASDVETIILVSKRQLDFVYGVTRTRAISDQLRLLADDPTVNGVIYPVENWASGEYGQWDNDACNPYAANEVAETIYSYLSSELSFYTNTKYIVIVGDDSIIPFYRIPDSSSLANEREYWLSAHLDSNNSTWAALGWGFLLTDNFYGDLNPKYWHGHGLYVPDRAVGRLVETPEEITATIGHYLSSGHSGFDPQTGLSTGYDFLTDSAEATRDLMDAQGLTSTTLISETWTATDLKNVWTGAGATRQDLASISAHFEHWHAIPPNESAGLFSSDEISNAATSPISTVVWSVGCHSGYNVHDTHSSSSTTALDFAQAFAKRQTGGFVGNTGYGLGDTTEIAYSEKLMLYFAQELGRAEDIPVGEALMRAKQRYVGGASSGGFSRYDEKVMIESTLYGLPMYRVTVPFPVPLSSGLGSGGGGHMVQLGGALDDEPYDELTFNFDFVAHTTGSGVYYTVQGYTDTQTIAGRPIQPLVISDVTELDTPARGVVVVAATYYTVAMDNPVIATLVTDTARTEPTFEYAGWYPTNIVAINRLGGSDNLVIVPAQFHSTSGVERLYTELTLRVYYTDTEDYMPPSIWSVESTRMGGTATFKIKASDDESGVAEVRINYEYAPSLWTSVGLTYSSSTGLWEGEANTSLDEFNYVVQVIDGAGNVSSSSNKGLYFAAEPNYLYLPLVMRGASR